MLYLPVKASTLVLIAWYSLLPYALLALLAAVLYSLLQHALLATCFKGGL
jgi:hypothetical protein